MTSIKDTDGYATTNLFPTDSGDSRSVPYLSASTDWVCSRCETPPGSSVKWYITSFLSLSSFAALAVTCYAFVAPDSALQKRGVCTDGSITSHSTVAVGDKIVEVSTVSCPASVASRSLTKRQSEGLLDVCDAICSDSCNNDSGDLPPEADDCDTIVDAITILNGSIAPTFTVDSGDMQQLTYGTCRYYFENLSNETLEYCWTALSDMGSAAGAACFPPTEPVYSEGVCQATTGLWVVGAAHS
ncbi:hypothetical protein WOLCODRAFT_139546 [Wolfiporia cocos MD-104 SS10]|uniref:Uncharacterized protein n=1 Tax=Wolfiporia cocos (strain MD-104) TaxID=742152 RepID=A0A2H3J7L9_WOLCO|nr:hypothetical protein WOLCODRAFT_139546 [Wolfiporia cocos MD-104 SS10]